MRYIDKVYVITTMIDFNFDESKISFVLIEDGV